MSCLKKFASLPQLNRLCNVRLISTQVCSSLRYSEQGKEVTHTGQAWDEKDYRNVRFTNASKIVNKNWAINLIAEQPIIECTERVVWCDGGDARLGHPKVYINLDKPGAHSCGYCGLRYQKKDDHHH
ncbi:hypothetical protein PVAND_006099 [Polypedilum vanderplanki]|uniref:NADH dehydrogenase [ubiquinone] iron-sulfur protein 6, mitochondrial n=1 Tax=Polypedilum vanderplanki TaxID=319348 RepID=A0A9J6C2J8_POLVA|nr:hypothetical protein PVAND_006099 [Polypedilum vanderplanki]